MIEHAIKLAEVLTVLGFAALHALLFVGIWRLRKLGRRGLDEWVERRWPGSTH